MISGNAALPGFYDYGEVVRSVLIAIAASYAALDLTGRVSAARGRVRLAWLSGGATAMGIGIWEMHFKGMLALHLPVPIAYDWPTVLASLLVAILASAFALYVVSRGKMGPVEAMTGSVLMGGAIAGMHYIGMAAMRLSATAQYSSLLVTVSILLAILFSLIGLLMAFGLREETKWTVPRRLGSATLMGVAVSAMHYTGMAAASFFPGPPPDFSHAVNISPLANNGIAVVTLIAIVAAMVTSSVDRRGAQEALRRSEEHLRLVIDTIPHQIWSGPPDGSLDFCNEQWRSNTGLTQEDLQGDGWQRMLHPADRDRVLRAWAESVAKGTPYEQEERHRRADGQYRWFLARGVPLRDSGGHIVRWYGTNTDIEDRKQAEDRLRLVVDTTPAMLHSARPDGYLDFFNKRWLEFVGLSLDNMRGWRWAEVVHPDDVEELLGKWRSSLASGEPFEAEARVRRADGIYRWTLHRKVPARDNHGTIIKWYGSVIDIEDRKRAEEALLGAQHKLAHVNRTQAMGELAAAIAHEVNQPLTAIVTNANFSFRQLKGSHPNLDELRAAITEIVNDGTRASAVIARIRTLLTKGAPERAELDINKVIREVIGFLRNELARNRVSLRLDLSPDLRPVPGDRVQLQQLVLNLISNSIDAMRTVKEWSHEILIKSAGHPDGVLIQVQDSGPGIDPEQADRIFEPFFTTKPEGIGMGLSIARSIVESHGGRLWAVAGNNGALFEFILPAQD